MKMEPFPGELVKQNNYKHVLTQQQIDWLCKYFPEVDNHTLMKKSGMNHSLLHRLARRYGLTKSEKGLKRILKNSARKIKSTCKYKRSESSHRYNAKKRGYVLPLDISEQGNERYNIYYTEGTRRGKIFEKNLVKDGFKVLPL